MSFFMLPKRRPDARYLLFIYLLAITCFGVFRLWMLAQHFGDIHYTCGKRAKLLTAALWIGVRFDTVITCYLIAVPFMFLGLLVLAGWLRRGALRAGYLFLGVVFPLAFLLCAADLPFYNQFGARLDNTVLAWKAHASFGIRMVLGEPQYYGYVFLWIGVVTVFLVLLRRICRAHVASLQIAATRPAWRYTPVFLLLGGAIFLGIRGRLAQKSPIVPGAAYISDDPTISALGLNAVFSFMKSLEDEGKPENARLHWLADEDALRTTADLLGADSRFPRISPVARMDTPSRALQGRNVVVVMMESMSTAKMGRYGNTEGLTPFLDSLAGASWAFDNIWSAGLHTYNGIYATLLGHPALMKRHPMEAAHVSRIDALPVWLRREGYSTLFFTTHDELFDNMSGFLSANGMERIVGQKDYPSSEVLSTLGVPDEFMFRFSIPLLNSIAAKKQPFFAAFMTGTDHGPYTIPTNSGYVPKHKDLPQQATHFADWSLRRFLQYAAAQPWYSNTLFVFIADHGALMGHNAYDVSFSYQHIPLVLFTPGYTAPKAFPVLGLQTDVPATVAGLVCRRPYLNNTLSTNLLQAQQKPYAIFSSDTRLACMSDSLLYIYRMEATQSLYRYRTEDLHDFYQEDSNTAWTMRRAAFAWLQASQWLLAQDRR